MRTCPDLRMVHQIPVLLAVPVPRYRSYGSRPRPLPHPRRRRRLRSTPELILALILPCHAPAADEPYRFCVTGSNAVGLSTMSRTRSPPSTYPIPTSASSLQAGRTPSYTYRSTPDTHHRVTHLTHRLMPQEGYGSMMASCLARSTTRPSHFPQPHALKREQRRAPRRFQQQRLYRQVLRRQRPGRRSRRTAVPFFRRRFTARLPARHDWWRAYHITCPADTPTVRLALELASVIWRRRTPCLVLHRVLTVRFQVRCRIPKGNGHSMERTLPQADEGIHH